MEIRSASKVMVFFTIAAFLLSAVFSTGISQASEKTVELKISGCRK